MEKTMNDVVLKPFVALIPACVLFAGSAIIFLRRKTMSSFFQLLGAAALVVVVLAHVLETLRVWPQMGWGFQSSVGHYLDLLCAILGVTLFSLGYLMHALDTCVQKKSERV
jgi:amino acid permease